MRIESPQGVDLHDGQVRSIYWRKNEMKSYQTTSRDARVCLRDREEKY